jgi:hypothetical protein
LSVADEPNHPDDERVRRLEYRDGAADREPVNAGQVIGGVVVAFAMVTAAIVVGIMLSLEPRKSGSVPFFVVVGAAVLACNVWAFLAYRKPASRWRGIGLWIGFGVAVLIEGACFGLSMR